MNTLKLLVLIIIVEVLPVKVFAWQGMPTPPLHIEGRWLKDPVGNNIMLHGWMQPTSSWFNGRFYSDPTTFTPEDCEEALNVYKSIVDLLSDPDPLFGAKHGWYNNFVRIWTPSDGWGNDGTVDTVLQDRAWYNMYIPYVEYCKEQGIYVVFIGNCPDGGTFMSAQHKSNMIKFWSRICNRYPEIKNADNVMFEICNEPVNIESQLGNGDWGSVSDAHDRAVQAFFQDIVDSIRATGANNIIWVPGLIWQDRLMNFATYPISGENIGYAGHMYPFGSNSLEETNNRFISSGWKACSDLYPIIVTEGSWHTLGNEGIRTGTTEVFGNAVKKFYDTQGNISWICGMTEELIGNMEEGINGFTYPEINSGRAGFDWWPQYTWCAPDDGTPEFKYASIYENNPMQIQVVLSRPIGELDNFNGFTVKTDNQTVDIDSVVLGDTSNILVINLSDSITNDNEIVMSYNNGNVISIFEKDLGNFSDTLVYNLLKGADPILTEVKTDKNGDTLIVQFNMKMNLPSDISGLTLSKGFNGDTNLLTFENPVLSNDSLSLLFSLTEQIYADYQLLFSYSGNTIVSSDSGILKTFSDILVTNYSYGLPVQIDSGGITQDGLSGTLGFSKPLASALGKSTEFTLNVNGESIPFFQFYSFNNTIMFSLEDNLHFGDTITLSYTPGTLVAADSGVLEAFSDFQLTNPIAEPDWVSIPGKIEAENYTSQSGIQTENTRDTGGGLNVGWIDDGDWLEYAIENTTTEKYFEIHFRVASPEGEGRIDFYLDNRRLGRVTMPTTGGWQSWQSAIDDITIGPGKHYLRIITTNGGFNFNYIEIKEESQTNIGNVTANEINIYPNPASNEMFIKPDNFRHNKVEIIDMIGNIVFSRSTDNEPTIQLGMNLPNGIYFVKISNEKQFQLKKIIIENK